MGSAFVAAFEILSHDLGWKPAAVSRCGSDLSTTDDHIVNGKQDPPRIHQCGGAHALVAKDRNRGMLARYADMQGKRCGNQGSNQANLGVHKIVCRCA